MDMKCKSSRLTLLMVLAAVLGMTSCVSSVFDGEGDCSVHCQLKFKYDMNMKFADAFPNAVPYVEVYLYDGQTGALVRKQVESGAVLARHDYIMEFEDLPLGTYDIVAWCGDGLQEGNFDLREPSVGESQPHELICTMDREEGGLVNTDVKQLYHGKKRVIYDQSFGVKADTISLTKNTNVVRVVLQHLSGIDVDPKDFTFEIKDENGLLAHDNTVMDDEVITYSPWSIYAGTAGVDADIYGTKAETQTSVSVAVAEFTVNRLVTENNPVLSIYNVVQGDKVLSIPLKDYALLVKGNYNKKMSDQEYLDRQDEYNLTFFLDEHGKWMTSSIIINSWHVVLQDADL